MLARMFDRRCRGYEAVGYTILLPASAIPGWPADVVLPSDPVWKRDYAGSVRRLVRDGVDTPLASLFVHAARAVPPGAEAPTVRGVQRNGFSSVDWRHFQTPRGASRSTSRCRSLSTASERWRSICSARKRGSPWSWTVRSISPIRWRTGAIDARTSFCRRTVISSCGFLPKMSAGTGSGARQHPAIVEPSTPAIVTAHGLKNPGRSRHLRPRPITHTRQQDAGKPIRVKKSAEGLNLQAVPSYPV